MSKKEIKTQIKELQAQNKLSLRTSEHLAISKQIWELQAQLEAL